MTALKSDIFPAILSVTLVALCIEGFVYYKTGKFPETVSKVVHEVILSKAEECIIFSTTLNLTGILEIF
jgi:hypothetical protein